MYYYFTQNIGACSISINKKSLQPISDTASVLQPSCITRFDTLCIKYICPTINVQRKSILEGKFAHWWMLGAQRSGQNTDMNISNKWIINIKIASSPSIWRRQTELRSGFYFGLSLFRHGCGHTHCLNSQLISSVSQLNRQVMGRTKQKICPLSNPILAQRTFKLYAAVVNKANYLHVDRLR